ncbi:MAG: hypothetical protein MSIBF_07150 [Candidatus Altiarchaeales archaeon IMC4]|nr:MAG: hypothetical protein MSIBF_07150 [Candidatus Altiarchaeales archaeon IMC4]
MNAKLLAVLVSKTQRVLRTPKFFEFRGKRNFLSLRGNKITMQRIINVSFLTPGFEVVNEGHIVVEDGRISDAADGFIAGEPYRDFLAVPGMINSHTHLGDAFAKGADFSGLSVNEAVGPKGLKWKLYENSTRRQRISAMRKTAGYMLSSGTTTFADFREFGNEGIAELRAALRGIAIKPVVLGRNCELSKCGGLGLNVDSLGQIQNNMKKIIAIHAGENTGEIEIALKYDPDVLIHFTKATEQEIETAARRGLSVVACPRSNMKLGAGKPPLRQMLDAGINAALGTDNAMINTPDMWCEMKFVFENFDVSPEEILRMATINGAKAFGLNAGAIEKGRFADIVFTDKPNSDAVYWLAEKCGAGNVKGVMVGGKLIIGDYGKSAPVIHGNRYI